MLLVGKVQHLFGLSQIALFEVMIDDHFELLHIEEVQIIRIEHRLVTFHTILLIVTIGKG